MARQAGRSSSLCRRPATPPDLRRVQRVGWPLGPSAMPSRHPGASRPPSGRCPAARRGPPGPRAPAQRLGRERSAPPHDAQVVLDFGQREAERLGVLDGAEETDRVLVVAPVPPRHPGGHREQAAPLVVPEGLDVDACPPGGFSGSHASIMNPDSGTEINLSPLVHVVAERLALALTNPLRLRGRARTIRPRSSRPGRGGCRGQRWRLAPTGPRPRPGPDGSRW